MGEVDDVALLAAICVKLEVEDRPIMRQVEMTLEAIQASKEHVSSDTTDCTRLNDLSIEGTDKESTI